MVQDCDLIDWKHSDEFFDKVRMNREYFYEYKKKSLIQHLMMNGGED